MEGYKILTPKVRCGMTRQEVIERLKSIKSLVDKYDDVMALREAIKVLEQEPKFIAKSDGTIEQIKNCDDCLFKKEWEKIGKLISVVLEKQNDAEYHGNEDMDGLYYCPICQQTTTVVKDGKCPKCGATMDELSTREQTEDAISRQATLEPYKRLKDTDTLCVALIRANIMQQPSVNPQEPKTGWIPVSERLPEEDERILISVNGKRGKRVRSATYLGGNCKSFWSDTGEFWDLNKKEDEKNLIAWMPLPEPYKAESEDKE